MNRMKTKNLLKSALSLLVAALIVISIGACGATSTGSNTDSGSGSAGSTQSQSFPKFQGTDFDGNDVDESLFGENSVTVLNFWFNGCSACVDEMPALEKFNQKLKEKGAELVGINVEAVNEKALKEAKKILSDQGASYRNISLKEGKEINDYLSTIYGFPTTVLVDRNGNIIGDPIVGSIDDENSLSGILERVDASINGKNLPDSTPEVGGDDISSLIEAENKIFTDHMDLWGKVLDSIPHETASQVTPEEYIELLNKQVTALKDSFTEDELKLLTEDIAKIKEIEVKIQSLGGKK